MEECRPVCKNEGDPMLLSRKVYAPPLCNDGFGAGCSASITILDYHPAVEGPIGPAQTHWKLPQKWYRRLSRLIQPATRRCRVGARQEPVHNDHVSGSAPTIEGVRPWAARGG